MDVGDGDERKSAFNAYIRSVEKGSQAETLGIDEIVGVGDFSFRGSRMTKLCVSLRQYRPVRVRLKRVEGDLPHSMSSIFVLVCHLKAERR